MCQWIPEILARFARRAQAFLELQAALENLPRPLDTPFLHRQSLALLQFPGLAEVVVQALRAGLRLYAGATKQRQEQAAKPLKTTEMLKEIGSGHGLRYHGLRTISKLPSPLTLHEFIGRDRIPRHARPLWFALTVRFANNPQFHVEDLVQCGSAMKANLGSLIPNAKLTFVFEFLRLVCRIGITKVTARREIVSGFKTMDIAIRGSSWNFECCVGPIDA
jgi:hypothetical protein